MSSICFHRTLLAASLLSALAGVRGTAQEPPRRTDQPPTFAGQVEMVVVDVVVTARGKGPVPGLRREDFVVTENGVPQEIQTFEVIDVTASAEVEEENPLPVAPKVSVNTGLQAMNARSFVIVLDQDHLTPVGAIRAKAAIAEFLRFGPRDGDTVMIVSTGGGSWWVTRAGEARAELGTLLKGVQGRSAEPAPDRITDWEAMRIWGDRDPIVQEQVRRRFEAYATGRQRMAEGFPVRGQERLTDAAGQELISDNEILSRAHEAYQMSLVRNRTTLVALARVIDSMGAVRGRKTVVLFSEGFLRDTRLEEHDAVIRTAQRANVALYFIDVRGLEAMPLSASAQFGTQLPAADVGEQLAQGLMAAAGSDELAVRTGGFTIKNTNDLERGLLRIAQEARHYYLLGYIPRDTRADGKWRKIGVKVTRDDVEIRARQGYFGPGGDKRQKDRNQGSWRPGLQQALDSPYEFQAVPLRLTHHLFGEVAPGKARALLTAEVDIRGLAFVQEKDKAVDTLEYLLAVVQRESGEVHRHDQKIELKLPADLRASLEFRGLPVSRELELGPGHYQARLVVRDTRAGTIGSIRHDFDIPALGGWRTSTPVLSDALEPKTAGAPLAPTIPARRTFAAGGTLYYQFEVYGSGRDSASGLPRVSAGFTLRTREGEQVMRVEPAPIKPTPEGRLARLGMVPLAGRPPGQYELVLDLRDDVTGKQMEVRERFSIEQPAGSFETRPAASGF
jgi:VWFA-related protein